MKQRVLVFSVDAMVYEDLQHLRGCRNTKKYFQNACGVRHTVLQGAGQKIVLVPALPGPQ